MSKLHHVRYLIERVNIDPTLQAVLESVFGPDLRIDSPDDGPGTIPEWDSVNHLNLILAVESEFGVQFDTADIPELVTVGKIQAKLALL